MSDQQSLGDRIAEKLIPPVTKFANLKPVAALKNGMLVVMPLTIIGSIFLLIANFPVTAFADWLAEIGLTPMLNQVYNATYLLIGLVAAVAIAYNYVKASGYEAFLASIISLCTYILFMDLTVTDPETNTTVSGVINMEWTNARGMVVGIIVGELVGVIYSWFLKRNIVIKLPDGVPPAVANSFTALIPGTVILTLAMIVFGIFSSFDLTLFDAIYNSIQTPLQGLTDSIGGVLVICFLIPFLWFFGIHGSSIVTGVVMPMLTANTAENQSILDAGMELTTENGGHIVTQQFVDNFVILTGSGITIGIVIYMVAWAKSAQYKALGRLSIAPAAFNINEPIIFGTPVVMNPLMFIPFILTPLLAGVLQYLALWSGLVPLYGGVLAPWTTPPIISGFIVGGWQAALLQVVILTISVAMYFPFIRKADQLILADEQALHEEHVHEAEEAVTEGATK